MLWLWVTCRPVSVSNIVVIMRSSFSSAHIFIPRARARCKTSAFRPCCLRTSTSCKVEGSFLPIGASNVNFAFEGRISSWVVDGSDERSSSNGLIVRGLLCCESCSLVAELGFSSGLMLSSSGGIGRLVTT